MPCKGICIRHKALGRYNSEHKRCQQCEIFIKWNGLRCPCCGYKLRTRPRNFSNANSKEEKKSSRSTKENKDVLYPWNSHHIKVAADKKGSTLLQFNGYGIAIDNSNNVYVADTFSNRIQKFNSTGTFITEFGSPGSGNGQLDTFLSLLPCKKSLR